MVLRYLVSILCGIAVLREKTSGIAVLSFYSGVCGIVLKINIQISCNVTFLEKNEVSLKRLDRGKKQLRKEESLNPLSTCSEC